MPTPVEPYILSNERPNPIPKPLPQLMPMLKPLLTITDITDIPTDGEDITADTVDITEDDGADMDIGVKL